MADRVAGRADFLVDLEAALQLLAVEGAESRRFSVEVFIGRLVEGGLDRLGGRFGDVADKPVPKAMADRG
jgi:hypothetical protein